jgi:hypothetical protein
MIRDFSQCPEALSVFVHYTDMQTFYTLYVYMSVWVCTIHKIRAVYSKHR